MAPLGSNKPKVSIVIVNWNTCDLLKSCLQSVYLETKLDLMEVIVVDNDSTDNSCEMVQSQFPHVKLIRNATNVGFAKATNQGFEASRGEYVLMLNSDTIILEQAIEKTLNFADNNPDAAVVGCKLLCPDGTFQNSCFRFPGLLKIFLTSIYVSQLFKKNYILNWGRYGCHDWSTPQEVDCVMGSFALIRHSVLREIGALDTDYFMYGEETDLCYRLKKAGWKVLYYPDAHVIHIQEGSQKSWADIAWSYRAKQRAILFFLCKWRHMVIAYIGNVLIVCFMIPRLLVWALLDVLTVVTHRSSLRKQRVLKGAGFCFHLRALFQPRLLRQEWSKT